MSEINFRNYAAAAAAEAGPNGDDSVAYVLINRQWMVITWAYGSDDFTVRFRSADKTEAHDVAEAMADLDFEWLVLKPEGWFELDRNRVLNSIYRPDDLEF